MAPIRGITKQIQNQYVITGYTSVKRRWAYVKGWIIKKTRNGSSASSYGFKDIILHIVAENIFWKELYVLELMKSH